MLTVRSSSIALLSAVAALSLSTMACSKDASDDASASSAVETVDASNLIAVDSSLPFVVKRVHVAGGPVLGAHWGSHNGPVVTSPNLVDQTQPEIVTRWFIPQSLNAPAGSQPLKTVVVADLPATTFWGLGGFVDMPFGSTTINAYSTPGGNFAGEILLYSKSYNAVLARAFVNGFYAGVGVTDGTAQRIVYSGLSGLSDVAQPEVKDSGLWASDVTTTTLAPTAPATSKKLISWTGASGPVVADNDGNVFVAAFVSGAAHSDEIYALTKTQCLSNEPVTQATIADADTMGTQSLAVASVAGSGKGWLFAKGYDDAAGKPLYATAYTATADAVAKDGDVIAAAIKPVIASTNISAFGDPKGNLWVSVEGDAGAWLIELEPKQAPAPAPTP